MIQKPKSEAGNESIFEEDECAASKQGKQASLKQVVSGLRPLTSDLCERSEQNVRALFLLGGMGHMGGRYLFYEKREDPNRNSSNRAYSYDLFKPVCYAKSC